jgi:hypothetical protein
MPKSAAPRKPKSKKRISNAEKIALRQDLITKLSAQRIARKERIDKLDVQIDQLKTAREELMAGYHEMQEEIDENLLQIEQLADK